MGIFTNMKFLTPASNADAAKIALDLELDLAESARAQKGEQEVAELTAQLRELRAEQQLSEGKLRAIDKSMAVIEFDLQGNVQFANDNFLACLGYTADEVKGKNHSMFVEADYRASSEYQRFWNELRDGKYHAGEFFRLGKNGKEIWLQASYNPVLDEQGKLIKIVKFASDITRQKNIDTTNTNVLAAINKSQGVIEFAMDGTVLDANENFLKVLGYSLHEIKGKHHRMFVEDSFSKTPRYQEVWAELNRGDFVGGEYKRLAKGGREIWIQATYNPILDAKGRPTKVVKFASDITAQKALQKTVEEVLSDTSRVISSLADGNLSDRMGTHYSGEFMTLSSEFNAYIESLSDMVVNIRDSASSVKNGAIEIASGNANLSQRTEEQAASLEETSSAMEEITTTVKQNAANSSVATSLSRNARDTAEKGGDIVSRAVTAMQAISAASSKINNIIGVIDEIAFQTNLLALNAAVEAARAGDQGRGFAVVADEVRSLAGRSASAAKEIKVLIKDSSEKVLEGSELVNQSGSTLEEIVVSVKKVNDIISEISSASEEQATGLEEVNRAVLNMDEMTQQNAALVEEAAAASESLESQANVLEELISFFSFSEPSRTKGSRR